MTEAELLEQISDQLVVMQATLQAVGIGVGFGCAWLFYAMVQWVMAKKFWG